MNFQDFHDYAKRLKPVIKQADKLECSKFLDELIVAHPEYAEKLKVVQTCFLSFQVIHSHLFDLANDAMQIERNYRARVDAGSNPLGLKLTDKAKAMIPNKCPHCNCGLLEVGSGGADFGGDGTFQVVRDSEKGYVLKASPLNDDTQVTSDRILFCPVCGRELQ